VEAVAAHHDAALTVRWMPGTGARRLYISSRWRAKAPGRGTATIWWPSPAAIHALSRRAEHATKMVVGYTGHVSCDGFAAYK
jgi:hypothetical protein